MQIKSLEEKVHGLEEINKIMMQNQANIQNMLSAFLPDKYKPLQTTPWEPEVVSF